jgi:hypothetical protein
MFYYPNILARYKATDLASFVWVGIEEAKRFNIALYKVCGKINKYGVRDGVWGKSNAARPLMTASELQFPLPTNFQLWNAGNKDEWTAFAKDENPVCLTDSCQEKWLSNYAGVLESLAL